MSNHGGYLLVDTLIANGVTHVFGMPGGQANAFYDALGERQDQITHILIRDETSAGYAADGFARVSGRIGVCDATVGPGSARLVSGLMEAYNSSVPILAIVSDHPRSAALLQSHGRISQGGNQRAFLEPFTKETFSIPSIDMIPKMVAAAIHTAVSGRPGPVVVEIPQDVFNDTSDVQPIAGSGNYPKYRCTAPAESVNQAVELLSKSERPLILAGGGVQLSFAHDEVSRLSKLCQIPIVTTLSGKGSISENEELALGVLGDMGNPAAKAIAEKADVILAIGYKHSQNSSYRWSWPRDDQQFIHIDIDPMELGRIYSPDVSLWGDAKETVKQIMSIMEKDEFITSEKWQTEVLKEKYDWNKIRHQECSSTNEPIWPQSIIQVVNDVMDDQDFLICDASFSSGWGAGFFVQKKQGRQILLPRGIAGLGYSLPAAIGVSLACPNSRVICISGDGAFSYNVGEIATLKQFNLPVVNIVLNNSVLGWAKMTQKMNFKGSNQSVELGEFNFGALSDVYGISAHNIKKIEELRPILEKDLQDRKPSVINAYTDQNQTPSMSYREALNKIEEGTITSHSY